MGLRKPALDVMWFFAAITHTFYAAAHEARGFLCWSGIEPEHVTVRPQTCEMECERGEDGKRWPILIGM